MITTVGPHRVKHGNVMDGISDLMRDDKAALFYSDPPWGDGNLKYWQTINTKMTGAPPVSIKLEPFLNKIFETAVRHTEGFVFIEYGLAWETKIIDKGIEWGLNYLDKFDIIYKTGSKFLPLHLHLFSTSPIVPYNYPEGYKETVTGTYGFNTLKTALAPFARPGSIILDPCCGMGYTAQAAIEYGMKFWGNEINKKRLEKTIARLNKQVYGPPPKRKL